MMQVNLIDRFRIPCHSVIEGNIRGGHRRQRLLIDICRHLPGFGGNPLAAWPLIEEFIRGRPYDEIRLTHLIRQTLAGNPEALVEVGEVDMSRGSIVEPHLYRF
jgi:hypothetical protein